MSAKQDNTSIFTWHYGAASRLVAGCVLLFMSALLFLGSPAKAQQIDITVNVQQARTLLDIACSGEAIDTQKWRQSATLQAQIAHHSQFGERFSLENYLKGLADAARCQVSEADPFRFASLVEKRENMLEAITFLSENEAQIGAEVAAILAPFAPADFTFSGEVIFLAASFSCGGFYSAGAFFVDIPCLASDIESEMDAMVLLVAHETYHAMQAQFAYPKVEGPNGIATAQSAYDFMFQRLAWEGTASHIGDMLEVEGDGRYASFSRNLAKRSFRQLKYNFHLFDFMVEAVGQSPDTVEDRFPRIFGLAFDGAFDQRSYFVGQQMAAEIEHSFGASAIPCVLAQPYENFLLAYDIALRDDNNLARSRSFHPATLDVARARAASRARPYDITACTSGERG